MKITIITVCKNAQNAIEKTIKSVVDQDYKNIEYIVIDGKSTDKTQSIIKKYKDKISTVISEPDNGIYDAMNKGIKISSGKIINFLNAGDNFYKKDTVSDILRLFRKYKSDIIYGDAVLYDAQNTKSNILKRHKFVDYISLSRWSICHQAIFTKKIIFDKYGKFNEKYKIAADYDWLLRLYIKNKVNFLYTNKVVVRYSIGGISWLQDRKRFYYERITIAVRYYGALRFIINNVIMRIRKKELYFRPYNSLGTLL